MGEIVKFDRPDEPLSFTGERFTSAASGQIEIEHLHRYLQARDTCRGKDVLDIASGEGYGSALLAKVARSVIGVELEPEVVAYASRIYGSNNLSFVAGDARQIPLVDGAVDVVTSFETIEHFYEHKTFLHEVKRVLRPGGLLIISTPDRDIYSPVGEPANRYHVNELSKDEMCAALGDVFAHVILLRQRTMIGSVLVPDVLAESVKDRAFTTFERRDNAYLERSSGLPRAKYIFAYASTELLAAHLGSSSVYIQTSELEHPFLELEATRRELVEAQSGLLEWHGHEQRWRGDITSIARELTAVQQRLDQRDILLAEARAEIQQTQDAHAATEVEVAQKERLLGQHEKALAGLRIGQQQVEVAQAATERELAAARLTLEHQGTSLRSLETECELGEKNRTALVTELETARIALHHREASLDDLRAECRRLQEALAIAHEVEAESRQAKESIAQELSSTRQFIVQQEQAGRAGAASTRMQAAFIDRFLGWRRVYPKPLSFWKKHKISKARRFSRGKSWAAAEAFYRQVLHEDPRLQRVWVQYAHAIKEQGDLWAALGAYRHAAELDPYRGDIYVHLGHIQKRLGLTGEAVATLRRALQLRPSLTDVWQDLRDLGQNNDELFAAVLSGNNNANMAKPGSGFKFKLVRSRARTAFRRKDWSVAASHYRHLLVLAPDDARVWLMFGHAVKEAGDPATAATAYLQALVLDPINQEPSVHLDALHAQLMPKATHPLLEVTRSSPTTVEPTEPGLHSGTFVLHSGQHLQPLGDGEFLSTGEDPQFALEAPNGLLPQGLTILSITTRVADPLLRPILYAWSGEDVRSFELPCMAGGQTVEWTLQLPDCVTEMRLDPTNEVGMRLAILDVSFRERGPLAEGEVLPLVDTAQQQYQLWVRLYDTLEPADVAAIRRKVDQLPSRPLISVVMSVYNPAPCYLRKALDTVLGQLYPNWELCISDDASTDPAVRDTLETYAARDRRIKIVFRQRNGHISASSNSALELVTGEFVALMDHDDELPAHALYMVVEELNRHPQTDVIYSDEDKIDADGNRHDPHFKTDWNLDLFYSQNFVAHLGVYRTALVRQAGSFRVGFEGSQDYDFTLRVLGLTEASRIRHIPFVLYHWRIFPGVSTFSSDNPGKSVDTARRALTDHFRDTQQDVEVLPIKSFPSWWRIKRRLPKVPPSVTLIIPTRDRVELLRGCVQGILHRTSYPSLDIIIVDNSSTERETLAYFRSLQTDDRVQVLRVEGPFNYSTLNNRAIEQAQGEYVGFLNNDIEVMGPDWLTEMMTQAVRPGIGAVGTKLLYANGSIQHAGVTLGVYGVAAHGHRHVPANAIGYFGRPQLQQELSAVTAAALVAPKHVIRELGGFNEVNLPVGYNDVDLCLRIRAAGYRIVYTPFAELRHLESASRGANVTVEQQERDRRERDYMVGRWGRQLLQDPSYNVNLSLADEDFRLAFPPRAVKPWLETFDSSFSANEQHRFDRIHRIDATQVRAIAARTDIVVASATPADLFGRLAESLMESQLVPARVVVVDASAEGSCDISDLPKVSRLVQMQPTLRVDAVRDAGQDFSLSRACNIGVRATHDAEYVLLIAEDVGFSPHWFEYLLKALAASPANSVVSSCIELPSGEIEDFTSFRDPCFHGVVATADGYDSLPAPRSVTRHQVIADSVLRTDEAIRGSVFLGSRVLLQQAGDEMFDEQLYAIGREEDLSRRLQTKGAVFRSTAASLVSLTQNRPRDIVHFWEHVHDYGWLNRKLAGERDSGVIEFVCPFHRGDVLIGLQVAAQAQRTGRRVRMHVAESLVPWVQDFAPGFVIEPVPVSVPSADLTALNLLRAYLHVVQRPDASSHIARSHPQRGLDTTGRNLVECMLEAVGLPRETKLAAIRPESGAAEIAADLLAPFGDKIILVHRSGGWQLKTIPDPILRDFYAYVKSRGFRVVQIGGPGDETISYLDGSITAGLSPIQWAAIFRRASALAGVDSWSSHFASILDTPQITFYGSTAPQHVNSKQFFVDRNAPSLTLGPVVDCSPCNSLVCLRAPVNFCMGYVFDKEEVGRFLDALPAPKKSLAGRGSH